jgi:hypothetical protein
MKSRWLLAAVPLALVLAWQAAPPLAVFAAALVSIVPLVGLIGESTERLAARLGPPLGGLLAESAIAVVSLVVRPPRPWLAAAGGAAGDALDALALPIGGGATLYGPDGAAAEAGGATLTRAAGGGGRLLYARSGGLRLVVWCTIEGRSSQYFEKKNHLQKAARTHQFAT